MTYSKPEIVRLAKAIDAVQGVQTKPIGHRDSMGALNSSGAYEADE
jgi:hypothetical protein